jgi:hypothetical protein
MSEVVSVLTPYIEAYFSASILVVEPVEVEGMVVVGEVEEALPCTSSIQLKFQIGEAEDCTLRVCAPAVRLMVADTVW